MIADQRWVALVTGKAAVSDRRSVWLMLSILVACIAADLSYAEEVTASPRKAVLVLSGERSDLPSIPPFEKAMRETLTGPDGEYDLFVEHLDSGRFSGPTPEQAFARHLYQRYLGMRIDAVVAFTESALDFALMNRSKLFPGVPIVAASIEKNWLDGRTMPAGVQVISITYDYRSTVELMRALKPDLQQIVVVHGTAEFDLRRLDDARNAIASFSPKLDFRAVGAMPLKSLEQEVRDLPSTSAVLIASMARDVQGRSYVGKDVVARLAAVSPVPIFGTFERHLVAGAVGAAITDNAALGRLTAMEVSRALAKQPFEARQVELGPASLHVNWRALQHWNIAEDLVPPGVAIEFRPPSLWTQNRTLISVIIGALLLQAICISLLILELARRRAIERNLQESESRFRTMADTAPIMISMGGPDARLTFVNKTYLDFTGRTLEQEVAQDCGVGVHPEDLNGYMASHVAACAERRVFTAECRLRRHDGEYRWVYCSRVPRHSSDGTFLGYIGTCIDITERKAAEEQLEKEHAFLRQVIDINPNFIFAKDRMGRFTMANKAVADAYGTTVDKLIGKTDAEFDDNTHEVQHFRQVDLEVMNTLQERFIAEEKITDADGNIRWLQTVKRPIVEKDGSVNQILGASTDITRRKAAESDARRNRADLAHVARVSVMGELAGSLAHELNQPLTAILSNTQAALRFMNAKPMDVVEVRETLEDVVHESKRASQVISHMRALVKKGPLEVAPIELGIIMREVGELMRSDAIMRGVQLEFDIQPNLPMVLGDRVQLEQVMLNLLLNAFDAMAGVPHHQRLAVVQVTREGDAAVKIAVHDQGVGLSTEMRERIFKPFFTTKKDGLGLGLSICRSIIEAHGGYLRADSSRDDGTTFYFTFPVVGAVQSTLQGEAA